MEDDPDAILETIGDEEARRVLASINAGPLSAKEIGERLDLSLPTVYRRLDRLQEFDLVRADTLIAENGNHYEVFECNFDSGVVSLDGEEFTVFVNRQDNLADQFSALWEEFGLR